MAVTPRDQFIPEPLNQPRPKEAGALPRPPLVDEKDETVDWTLGRVFTANDGYFSDAVFARDLLCGCAA